MSSGNVLLVEEVPNARAAYARVLEESGFLVRKAQDGNGVLERLGYENFDVILADIRIPEKDGLVLLRDVHAVAPDLPMVVLVPELNNQFAVRASELGAVQSLVKPVEQDLLRRTVSRAARLRQMWQRQSIADSLIHAGATPVRMNATKVKNQMGQVLDKVLQGEIVLITKHDTPRAAVIPIAEFERLSGVTEERLGTLSRRFDAMLARMQTPAARKGMKAAFDASPKQLAQAAVRFASKRG